MSYVWFSFICIVWGGSFILMKKATVCFSPAAVSWGRIIGGSAVLGLAWWWRREQPRVRLRDAFPLALVVCLGFAWPYSIQASLVARHGSAFIGMTVSLTPILTIVASILLLGAYPTPRQLLGVCGALAFLALLLADGVERRIPALDLAGAVSVPAGYAVTNTIVRRWLRHVPALELTLVSLVAAGLVMTPLALASPSPCGGEARDLVGAVAALAVLGVIGTGVAMALFNRLIHEHGPLFAGMVTNLVPVGALLFGWLDAEQVTGRQVAALAGLLAMVTLVQFGAARPAPDQPLPVD